MSEALRLSRSFIADKSFKIIIYGFQPDELEFIISSNIRGPERTKIVNNVLSNILKYMKINLELNDEKIYLYAEKKFSLLKKFSFKHLHDLSFDIPIIIIYTEVFLLQHQKIQKKILQEFKIQSEKQSMTSLTNISEVETKEPEVSKYILSDGICTQPDNHEFLNGYALFKKNQAGPFSYVYKINLQNKRIYPPIYYSREYIEDNFNQYEYVQQPFIQKAFKLTEKGDLILTDQDIIESQKGVVKELMKQATFSIFKGGMPKMSLPIKIFDTSSQIEKIAQIFSNTDLLHSAVKEKNQLEKFKYVITFIITGVYHSVSQKKPFNPYIGETLQGNLIDGTKIYVEHIQHEPPMDAFYIVNEEHGFKVSGTFKTMSKMSANEFVMNFRGLACVEINQHTIYAELAHVMNKGLMYGQRKLRLQDNFVFYFPDASLKAKIEIGDEKMSQRVDGITGGIYSTEDKVNCMKSTIGFDLFQKKQSKEIKISNIEGQWTQSIFFDDKQFWSKLDPVYQWRFEHDVLPSDFRFREDCLWLMYGNKDQAQEWKILLEHHYREDRHQREKLHKHFKRKLSKK